MRFHFLLILVFLATWATLDARSVTPPHPYHVSVFNVDYNSESQSLEITVKVFVDDMALALKKWSEYEVDFDNPTSNPFFKNYFLNTTKVKVNGSRQTIEYLGKEADIESVWIYLEVPVEAKPETITFKTSLLTEVYEDQMNIVHLKLSEEEKQSGRLNKDRLEKEFDFR